MVRYVFLIVCLLLTACSDQKKADNYDDFKDRLIFELFKSVEKGEHQKTFKTLSRLRVLISHNAFLDELYVKEENNLALIKVDKALELGDLNTASMQAVMAEDRQLQSQIQALKLIEDYTVQKPYTTSGKAYSALKRLTGIHPVIAENSHYKKWLKAEQVHADNLYKKEYAELLDKAFNSYARKLISSSKYADFTLLHLKKKQPSKAVLGKLFEELCSFDPELETVKPADFTAKVSQLDNAALQTLRGISAMFEKGENLKGLDALKAFVAKEGKVSRQLKLYMMQKSKKLRRVLNDVEFRLIDDVIDKLKEVNEIEEELRRAREEATKKNKTAERESAVVNQGNYLETQNRESVQPEPEEQTKEDKEKSDKLEQIRKRLR